MEAIISNVQSLKDAIQKMKEARAKGQYVSPLTSEADQLLEAWNAQLKVLLGTAGGPVDKDKVTAHSMSAIPESAGEAVNILKSVEHEKEIILSLTRQRDALKQAIQLVNELIEGLNTMDRSG